jgi:putative heme transporter
MDTMAWPRAVLIALAATGSMAATWIMICSVLPSIRLREAAAVNLGSTVVANTVPAGGAVAMGVSWAMLSSWGVGTEEYVLYTLVSGTWNVFARLGLPVLALLALLTAGRPEAGLVLTATAGLALLAAAAAGLGLLIRGESFALGAGRALQRALTVTFRLARKRVSFGIPGSLAGFRSRASTLIAVRGWRITAATLASNLTLWLVLLACLRGVGLAQGQVSWQTSLIAFASIRLLTVLPITPAGLGIAELGLTGILAVDAGHGVSHPAMAQVTAAVLLYRAVTYLLPIPIGVIAWFTWRHAPGLLHAQPRLEPWLDIEFAHGTQVPSRRAIAETVPAGTPVPGEAGPRITSRTPRGATLLVSRTAVTRMHITACAPGHAHSISVLDSSPRGRVPCGPGAQTMTKHQTGWLGRIIVCMRYRLAGPGYTR